MHVYAFIKFEDVDWLLSVITWISAHQVKFIALTTHRALGGGGGGEGGTAMHHKNAINIGIELAKYHTLTLKFCHVNKHVDIHDSETVQLHNFWAATKQIREHCNTLFINTSYRHTYVNYVTRCYIELNALGFEVLWCVKYTTQYALHKSTCIYRRNWYRSVSVDFTFTPFSLTHPRPYSLLLPPFPRTLEWYLRYRIIPVVYISLTKCHHLTEMQGTLQHSRSLIIQDGRHGHHVTSADHVTADVADDNGLMNCGMWKYLTCSELHVYLYNYSYVLMFDKWASLTMRPGCDELGNNNNNNNYNNNNNSNNNNNNVNNNNYSNSNNNSNNNNYIYI